MTHDLLSSELIKAEAKNLGFDVCGLAPCGTVDEPVTTAYREWLSRGENAGMTYLANYLDKRSNPSLLVEGARTIVSVALNYYPQRTIPADEYQVAYYAYGKDYHDIIRAKLLALSERLRSHYPTLHGRPFCDTAPVLERYWAWKAGLGWIGKNSMLIVPKAGSYFFLGELILDKEADGYGTPLPDHCGNCNLCRNSCPMGAIEAPCGINASRCINYLTIENKDEIEPSLAAHIHHTIYGCDCCQKVCPWNRYAKPHTTVELRPSERLLTMTKSAWENLTEDEYKVLFKDSAVKRAKYKGLLRNIRIAQHNREKEE